VLLQNSTYLNTYSIKLDSELLQLRCVDNKEQAANVDGKDWGRYRKVMREQQNMDLNQQRAIPSRGQ
jgi:hypothetical protein